MFGRLLRKKRVLVGLTVAMMAVAGVAFAYFSSTGSGTGSATVGTAAAWEVTVAAPTGGPLFPGSGTDTLVYYVKNNSAGPLTLNTVTAKLRESGGLVYSGGNPAAGCYASWFTVGNSHGALPYSVAGSTYIEGSATVALNEVATENQNACQGVAPEVTVEAS